MADARARVANRRRIAVKQCPVCRAVIDTECVECDPVKVRRKLASNRNKKLTERLPDPIDWMTGEMPPSPEREKARKWWAVKPTPWLSTMREPGTRARCTRYGITLGHFMRLAAQQDGRCAICSTEFPSIRKMNIDHDHYTEKVRGLLCTPCNTGLGMLGIDGPSSRERVQSVRNYLDRRPV